MYVLLYVSYLYICNVIDANKNKLEKKRYQKGRLFKNPSYKVRKILICTIETGYTFIKSSNWSNVTENPLSSNCVKWAKVLKEKMKST